MLSIVGGKLTTYRILAEQALEKLEPHLGALASAVDVVGAVARRQHRRRATSMRCTPRLAASTRFSATADSRRLARAYGTRAMRLLEGVKSRADMGEEFGGGLTRLEVDYLVREEWARSADDVLWRHTKAGLRATPAEIQRLRDYVGR